MSKRRFPENQNSVDSDENKVVHTDEENQMVYNKENQEFEEELDDEIFKQ